MRQVRRIETRRDDPLVDGALQNLATRHYGVSADRARHHDLFEDVRAGEEGFEQELTKILRGLCHTGAVLAVAEGLEKAVIVRETNVESVSKTVVDRQLAEALALRDWISCGCPGRLSRYHITTSGRSALSAMMAAAENRAQVESDGFSESQSPFLAQGRDSNVDSKAPRRVRYGLAESPLDTLARLHDRDGKPFLSADLVGAGERLRVDFELAQIGDHLVLSQNQFNSEHCGAPIGSNPVAAARIRATGALSHLGAGVERHCSSLMLPSGGFGGS